MARARSSSGAKKQSSKRAGPARSSAVRKRIRDMTVEALRDRERKPADLSATIRKALEHAADAVERALPPSRLNVLRQVSAGLGDALHAVQQAGAQTMQRARETGRKIVDSSMPQAARGIRAANNEFLRAVGTFARQTSDDLAGELNAFVRRARRTTSRVRESAGQALQAADGRWLELTGETARVGMKAARSAAGQMALAASGMLEGLGETLMPRKATPARKPRSAARPDQKAKRPKRKAKSAG